MASQYLRGIKIPGKMDLETIVDPDAFVIQKAWSGPGGPPFIGPQNRSHHLNLMVLDHSTG
jgi:hypothetical protein